MFAEFIWNKNGFEFFLIGIFVAMVATFGDLIQSAFKRYVNVKDSGKIIPGHGGVFDRMDSVMLSSIVIGLVVWKMAGNVF
jgi:phosphatidate cytidylyltransferase